MHLKANKNKTNHISYSLNVVPSMLQNMFLEEKKYKVSSSRSLELKKKLM